MIILCHSLLFALALQITFLYSSSFTHSSSFSFFLFHRSTHVLRSSERPLTVFSSCATYRYNAYVRMLTFSCFHAPIQLGSPVLLIRPWPRINHLFYFCLLPLPLLCLALFYLFVFSFCFILFFFFFRRGRRTRSTSILTEMAAPSGGCTSKSVPESTTAPQNKEE